MQVYANSNRVSPKTILFFILILFVAFLPVSSFQFFIKNDAFSGYFPPKFFMSESLHAGHLPLWNPYINFGIPQYGDMSSGFWSPITWLIASTVGYNAYVFTIEIFFYILLGGLGMYTLLGYWNVDSKIKFIGGIAFMCCGYNIGHLQHFNWLSGTAFLPWCMWAYLILFQNFSFKNLIRTALLFYLLFSSAHPGISIGACYFFAAIMFFQLLSKEKTNSLLADIKRTGLIHLLLLSLILLLSAGMLTGYLDIMPHFLRGEKISLQNSLSNPTNIQSWTSSLIPFGTVKNDNFFQTDPSMRNCYFSLTLLLFFLIAIFKRKTSWQKFLLITGISFALLSAGGFFKTMAYNILPGIGYVRLNGEFRIFAIVCFIILAAIELQKWKDKDLSFSGSIKWIYYSLEIILFGALFFGIYKTINTKEGLFYSLQTISAQPGIALKLKAMVDAVSFYDCLWIQGIVQLLLLWSIKYSLLNNNFKLLKNIVIADIILSSLFNIPFTGAGKASVADVQHVINKSPNGIPIPVLQPLKNIDSLTTKEKGLTGDWSMYNKQIGSIREVAYPIALKNTFAYFDRKDSNANLSMDFRPYLFTAEIIDDSSIFNIYSTFGFKKYDAVVNQFSPDKISLNIKTETASNIVYLQNHYPHWFYYTGKERKTVEKAGFNFMSAPIPQGESLITFSFEPKLVKWMMAISAFAFLLLFSLFFILKSTPFSPSLQ